MPEHAIFAHILYAGKIGQMPRAEYSQIPSAWAYGTSLIADCSNIIYMANLPCQPETVTLASISVVQFQDIS
jgi:hypothetical protein